MKIKFMQDHTPKGSASDIPTYEAGKTYPFFGRVAESYARKYVARGYAVEVGGSAPRKPKAKKPD